MHSRIQWTSSRAFEIPPGHTLRDAWTSTASILSGHTIYTALNNCCKQCCMSPKLPLWRSVALVLCLLLSIFVTSAPTFRLPCIGKPSEELGHPEMALRSSKEPQCMQCCAKYSCKQLGSAL